MQTPAHHFFGFSRQMTLEVFNRPTCVRMRPSVVIVATRLQAQAAMARELASVANCGQRFSMIPHGNHGDNNQTSLTS